MKRTRQIQVVVALAIILMIGFLFAQPIRGLVTPTAPVSEAGAAGTASSQFTLADVSMMSKSGLSPELVAGIEELEKQLGRSEGAERVKLLQELANRWEDLNKPAPQGFIYEEMAQQDGQFDYWLKAGNAYRKAYTNLQDTVLSKELTGMALHAYQEAMDLNPSSLEAKTGLGAAMVTGTNNPMAGIALLREVVTVDPKNLEANKTLGQFSMQSRQFDRAIERFLTVIEIKPDVDSYFYLGLSYEEIGLKKEAIDAFQKSKAMAADPTFSQFIDRKVDELSK